MKPLRIFLLVASLSIGASVWAQYQWIDHNGRRVFSDRPPPSDIAEQNIIVQPKLNTPQKSSATPAEDTPDRAADPTIEPGVANTGTDFELQKELDKKQQQADAAEAAEQKAQEQRQAAVRADNCRRARSAVATLESGRRMAQMNEKGEREILTDAQRRADLERAQKMVRDNCN